MAGLLERAGERERELRGGVWGGQKNVMLDGTLQGTAPCRQQNLGMPTGPNFRQSCVLSRLLQTQSMVQRVTGCAAYRLRLRAGLRLRLRSLRAGERERERGDRLRLLHSRGEGMQPT